MACVRTKLRQARGVSTMMIDRGLREAGMGGRSSVAGITATVFGGTGFLGKLLLFELGKSPTHTISVLRWCGGSNARLHAREGRVCAPVHP